MAKMKKWTTRRQGVFLDVLRSTANVSAACRAAGVSRATAYQFRQLDEGFRNQWEAAQEEALDTLEETLRRRALEGIEKPVYYAGKECGKVVSYNDNLGMFLLKSKRRHIYGDDAKTITADDGGTERSVRDQLITRLKALAKNRADHSEPEQGKGGRHD